MISKVRVMLLIEQPNLTEAVMVALDDRAFDVRVIHDAEGAQLLLSHWHPQLALIDVDSGHGGWIADFRRWDCEADRAPVIALSQHADLGRMLAAFETGVDDFVTMPFSPEELRARAIAVMRRTYHESVAFTPTIRVGELEIDILNRRVCIGANNIHLTPAERDLLYLLAANAGRPLTRDQIMDSVWGVDYLADSNVVDKHVRNLRVKLHDSWRRPRYIATVPGRGYRFIPGSPITSGAMQSAE